MKKLLFFFLFLSIPGFACTDFCDYNCNLWQGELSLTTGYRNDTISTKIRAFDFPGVVTLEDKLRAKDIDIFKIGIKGRAYYCSQAFVRGFVEFGSVHDGKYRDEVTVFPSLERSETRASIRSGKTRDYAIGVGYFFPCFDCFRIGPTIGFSYHYQKIKLSSNATSDGIPDPVLNRLTYDVRWQGPWLGAEAEFLINCFRFNLGYEYHLCVWRANWNLAGPDVFGGSYSDKRASHRAHGHVVFLEGNYFFCNCWIVGFGLKYQDFRARRGIELPRAGSFAAVGLSPFTVDRIPNASWKSAEIQLNLGYLF
jgi:hypothetical protein